MPPPQNWSYVPVLNRALQLCFFVTCFLCCAEDEVRVLHVLGRCSTTKLYPPALLLTFKVIRPFFKKQKQFLFFFLLSISMALLMHIEHALHTDHLQSTEADCPVPSLSLFPAMPLFSKSLSSDATFLTWLQMTVSLCEAVNSHRVMQYTASVWEPLFLPCFGILNCK